MAGSRNQKSKLKKLNSKNKFLSKLILFLFSFLLTSAIINPHKSQAQNTSCDLCGWCGTESATKPQNWDQCARCIFPTMASNLGISNPTNSYSGPKPTINPTNPYYPSTPETSKNWTVFGCLDTAPGGFTFQIYRIIVSISSGFTLLAIIYGSFTILTAAGDPLKVKSGQNIITGAIFGILLIVFSVFFLRLIGFEIIKIPGFG